MGAAHTSDADCYSKPSCETRGCTVTTVNTLRTYSSVGLVVCAASAVMTLAACSSDKPASSKDTSSTAPAFTQAMSPASPPPATADSAYERGPPAQFPLDGVVPGFQKAIAGQKVGSTVGFAMASADGYPDGQPQARVQKGWKLIFAIKLCSAGTLT